MSVLNIQKKEEIFETPDPEPRSVRPNFEVLGQDSDRENIEQGNLAPSEAFKVFQGKQLERGQLGHLDFSDSIGKRKVGEFSLGGKGSETVLERYNRVAFEVKELIELFADQSKEEGLPSERLRGELLSLQEQLASAVQAVPASSSQQPFNTESARQVLASLQAKRSQPGGLDNVNLELKLSPEDASSALKRFGQLEKRLAALELSLGSEVLSAPLSHQLATVEQSLALLTTALNPERLRAELADAAEQVKQLQAASGSELASNVSKAYDLMQRWEETNALLPVLVARFKSLRTIHEQANNVANSVASLQQQQSNLGESLERTGALLLSVQAGLEANMTTIDKNMQQLLARIQQLKA